MIGILVALLIIVALVVGAFLILNYDAEKKMTNTTATTDYQETIEYKGHTYVSVSYTHLDVYKRQGQLRAGCGPDLGIGRRPNQGDRYP